MEITTVAEQFGSFLMTKTRDNGVSFVCTTKDRPEWVSDIIHAVHGDMFPDDWTYATIKECAEYIAENGDDDSDSPEPEIYTSRLLDWLKEYPNAVDAVDEAIRESGVGQYNGLTEAIMYARASVIREIHYSLIQAFQDRADAAEEEGDAE